MLTILANVRINSPERLQHLKDGFLTFNKISDNWLINVRGIYRQEALDFLKKRLKNKMIVFDLLDDKRGWLKNVLDMLKKTKHDYVLIWNEDHLNVAPQRIYQNIVKEMKEEKCDYFSCSWWHFGKYRQAFDKQNIKKGKHIDTLLLTKDVWSEVMKAGHQYYLISLMGIFRKAFLEHLIQLDQGKLPVKLTFGVFKLSEIISKVGIPNNPQHFFYTCNNLFFHRLRKYSDETPFELEKDGSRTDILPIKLAIPNRELFACIDDDLGVEGYQLKKRSLYTNSFSKKGDTFEKNAKRIIEEINFVLDKIDASQIDILIENLLNANKIIVCGAGRVGMVTRAFGMRLSHLGLPAYSLGDSSVPRLERGDLLLASSGSGETQTIYDLVTIAKQNGAKVALVTGNPESRMGKLADVIVRLPAPSKSKPVENFISIQPMTTLNEQCLWLFYDALVLLLMKRTKQTNEDMWKRHVNLE